MRKVAFILALLLTVLAAAQPTRLPDGRYLKIETCSDNIVRVRVSSSADFPESLMERYGVLKKDWEGGSALRIIGEGEKLSLRASDGRVIIEEISVEAPGSGLCRALADTDGFVIRGNSFSRSKNCMMRLFNAWYKSMVMEDNVWKTSPFRVLLRYHGRPTRDLVYKYPDHLDRIHLDSEEEIQSQTVEEPLRLRGTRRGHRLFRALFSRQ